MIKNKYTIRNYYKYTIINYRALEPVTDYQVQVDNEHDLINKWATQDIISKMFLGSMSELVNKFSFELHLSISRHSVRETKMWFGSSTL